jgi:hypothetical protein
MHPRAGLPTYCPVNFNEMNSGSDSDPFDEGGLTARGRKGKTKSGARASEKGKQKANDVRTLMPFVARQYHPKTAALALHSRVMPGRPHILVHGTQCRKTRLGVSPVPSRNCSRADGDEGNVYPPPLVVLSTQHPLTD